MTLPKRHKFAVNDRVEYHTAKFGVQLGTVRGHLQFSVLVQLDDKVTVSQIDPRKLKLHQPKEP